MKNIILKFLWILVLILVCIHCAHKTMWQGKYIAVKYTRHPPKEDFRANGYVVVAFDILSADKYSQVIYRFEIMQNGKKEGTIELCDRSLVEGYFRPDPEYNYFLLAGDSREVEKSKEPFLLRKLHKMYGNIPDFETLKNDVIEVFSGK